MEGAVIQIAGDVSDLSVRPRFAPLQKGIALRLLAFILVFSSAVTLISTAMQLYWDYRRDVDTIETRLMEIQASNLGSLSSSLWSVDTEQLRLQLEGMLRLPDMQSLEVRESYSGVTEPLTVAVGRRNDHAVMAREYPIIHEDRGVQRVIGTLYVEATLVAIYQRLIETGMGILISQGIKTFLVSLFTLYIVWRLVTRHLVEMARFLGQYDIRRPSAALRLDRRSFGGQDELDKVVAAFNGMCISLERAYVDLRESNAELERDIIARRQAEAEVVHLNAVLEQRVRQRTAELEAANKELASFSYSVSHDLRAPLRRIEGFGRILAEEYATILDDRAHHCLNRIRGGSREMGEMIDSFLKLSRSTRGELTLEPVNLSALVANITATLAEKDPDRRVEMVIQPELVMDGDKRLMTVALTNLLDNAWKYTRNAEQPKVEFGVTEVNGRNAYFVKDNGAGFDMAFVDRLYVPFNRLHKAEDFEGTGIGLATVQRIIARHGGRSWAEGIAGQGATIYFTCWEGESQ